MIAITGATGQLGHLIVGHLLKNMPGTQIIACGRNLKKAHAFNAQGVKVCRADYDDPASLDQGFAGVDRLLFISASEVGKRSAQHRNVIESAKRQKVGLIVYTSLLHADTSPLGQLAEEHRATEAMLKASGIPYIILRNSWYTENYTASIPAALANGVFYGSAGNGRIASATRNDYAEAAAKIISLPSPPVAKVYELAGDQAYTLADLAAEISRQTGREIPYRDIPETAYRDALIQAKLPPDLAAAIASYDVAASKGALFDDGRQLSRLLGRPTTLLSEAVAVAVRQAGAKK